MRHGIRIKIDVTKIDKSLLFEGKKGKYLDATVFMDTDQVSEYGDNGMIRQDVPRDSSEKGNILGNVKIFWSGESDQKQNVKIGESDQKQSAPQGSNDLEDDIPF